MPSDHPDPARAFLDPIRASFSRQVQAMPGYPSIFDSGAQWSLRTAANLLPFAWARDLAAETGNKLRAFSEFQDAKRKSSRENDRQQLFAGDPHTDIWRAEGLGAHLAELQPQASESARLDDWCSRDQIPPSFLLPLHTGGGLSLAKTAVRNQVRTPESIRPDEILSEFHSVVEQRSNPDLRNATFEALGLVLQTLHPELLRPITDDLKKRSPAHHRLVWHGAGRGHYFDPFRLFLPSSLRSQSYLSATDDGTLNRLAGYAWAATMVNLREPATAVAVIASLPLANKKSLAAAAHGVSSASLVWLEMTADPSPLNQLDDALAARGLFRNPSASTTIREAITRRLNAHPSSTKALGALFSFDPDHQALS